MRRHEVSILSPPFILGTLLSLSGCSTLYPPPPGLIIAAADAESGSPYKLYQPTTYAADRDWPLAVLCAAGPWPTSGVLLSDWGPRAEQDGLLLLLPELHGGGRKAKVEDLQRDEEHILAAINHVRGRCRVREDQVLIAGYGTAARPAAWVGLRHPEVFRMVALLQPHFAVEDLAATEQRLDAHQPALVVVKYGDIDKEKSLELARWLQDRQVSVSEVRTSGARHTFPEVVLQLWQRLLRQQPWIHVEVFKTGPRTLRLRARTSFHDIKRYEWNFGDGQNDVVASPEHTYARPGAYEVTLTIHAGGGHAAQTRRVQVSVTE